MDRNIGKELKHVKTISDQYVNLVANLIIKGVDAKVACENANVLMAHFLIFTSPNPCQTAQEFSGGEEMVFISEDQGE